MPKNLKQKLPVLTADDYQLGQAHTMYHRQAKAQPEKGLFASYLMVVNMTIGDEYYVPTDYIDEEKRDETAVWLTLTRNDIKNKQLTRLPQFMVEDRFTEEKLAEATAVSHEGKPMDTVMPLPPNLSANSAVKQDEAEEAKAE